MEPVRVGERHAPGTLRDDARRDRRRDEEEQVREAEADERRRLGRTREIQRRFNVSVSRARVPEKASTLRDRSER